MSISEEMSNSEAKLINVEDQIIPLCIQYQTAGKCDWNPNIGQSM